MNLTKHADNPELIKQEKKKILNSPVVAHFDHPSNNFQVTD